MYRKRKQWKHNRYGAYLQKLQNERALKDGRQRLAGVLDLICDKQSQDIWDDLRPKLENMKKELDGLGEVPSIRKPVEVIKYCVSLFEVVSRYQDDMPEILCTPEGTHDACEGLKNNLYYCGRHEKDDLRHDSQGFMVPYWNTTKKGEPITMDNIMFGPDIGLPQKPASYWVSLSKKKKVCITEETEYKKGKFHKDIIVWATDGIVKCGVHKLCTVAKKHLTQNLGDLLAV